MRLAAAILVLTCGLWIGAAAAKPERIVSTHMCADQLLLLLAERSQLASISYFAANPNLSEMAAAAKGVRLNHGLVEEILPLEPDLVFAGAFAARPTIFLFRRLGVTVVELPLASTFDDISQNIRLVASKISAEKRGETLINAFDAALAEVPQPLGAPPVAALYWAKGYTPASASLAGHAARRAGFIDLGKALGLAGAARVSLEQLLKADPALLVKTTGGPASLADLPLQHPALRAAFPENRTIAMPDRLWICGAPFVAEAVRRLAFARERLVQ